MSKVAYRILIVEDDELLRRNLRAYLEDEGFKVIVAGSAEEGLKILTGAGIDAAIVDIRLPGIDGNTFIERAHRLDPCLRFVIYTGSAGYKPSRSLRTLGIGEKSVFIKPISDMALLAGAINRLLEKGTG